jgi:hypothetical protein
MGKGCVAAEANAHWLMEKDYLVMKKKGGGRKWIFDNIYMLSVGPEHTRAVNRNRANLWEVPARYGALLSKYHTLW